MIFDKIDRESSQSVLSIIKQAGRVVIMAHISPDGDAMGAALAMSFYLSKMGKDCSVVMPSAFPPFFRWMPGSDRVLSYHEDRRMAVEAIKYADTAVCLDFNSLSRLCDEMANQLQNRGIPTVLIDHHLSPDDFASSAISIPSSSSTCLLLYRLFRLWESDRGLPKIDKNIATSLYTGMMTDTGNFSYNSSDPVIYEAIAHLIKCGIDKDLIFRNVNNNYSADRMRLIGYALQRLVVLPQFNTAIISLSKSQLAAFNFRKGDTEGLVNMPLQIADVSLSVFAKEDEDLVKLSFRSEGAFPTNLFASTYFGGGGHLNASGGSVRGATVDETVQMVKDRLSEFVTQHNLLPALKPNV